MSEDPIGLEGGDTNFYSYVFAMPVVSQDPSGLQTVPIGGGKAAAGIGIMISNYNRMRKENTKGNDRYFHCQSNCKATKIGIEGEEAAGAISDAKEWKDENISKYPKADCIEDQKANQFGREVAKKGGRCEQECFQKYPYKR